MNVWLIYLDWFRWKVTSAQWTELPLAGVPGKVLLWCKKKKNKSTINLYKWKDSIHSYTKWTCCHYGRILIHRDGCWLWAQRLWMKPEMSGWETEVANSGYKNEYRIEERIWWMFLIYWAIWTLIRLNYFRMLSAGPSQDVGWPPCPNLPAPACMCPLNLHA